MNGRKTNALVGLLVVCLCFCAIETFSTQKKIVKECSSKIFLKLSSWEKPPLETGLVGYEWTAYATMIHIEKDGTFEMIGCILIRSRSHMGISAGDKQTIWIGKIEEKGRDKICVRYRQVMDIAGMVSNSPERESEIIIYRDYLIFDGDIYDKTEKIKLPEFMKYMKYVEKYKMDATNAGTVPPLTLQAR